MADRICNCGAPIEGHHNLKYCKMCASCTEPSCTRPRQGRGLCSSHYAAWHRSQRKYQIICNWCGKVTTVERKRSKHCSYDCAMKSVGHRKLVSNATKAGVPLEQWIKDRPYRNGKLTRLQRGQRKLDKAATGSRGRTIWVTRTCKMCGQSFTVASSYKDRCCSTSCTKRNKREILFQKSSRRRARKRKAYVEPVDRLEVFKRDGWRCYICGKKTLNRKQWHNRKATVDHVIPLAKGGTHEMANCRTACWMCNSSKSDGGGGEQLLLAV